MISENYEIGSDFSFGSRDFTVVNSWYNPNVKKPVDDLMPKKLTVCKKCKYFVCEFDGRSLFLLNIKKNRKIYHCKKGNQSCYKKEFLEINAPMECPNKLEHVIL